MRQPLEHLPAGRFFGSNERLLEYGGFTLSEVLYRPAQRVPPHGHQLSYFCLSVSGGYWEQYGRRRVDHSARTIVFHPPGDEHYGDISRVGLRSFNIEIDSRRLEQVREHGRIPDQPTVFEGGELVRLAARLHRQLGRQQAGLPLLVEGLGLELLGLLVREPAERERRMPNWLRRAAERLHDEMDRPVTLDAVAADLGVSPIRLSRNFRRFFGESVGDYSRRVRIEHACRLLSEPAASLADIALETGFADQSHFTRTFRRFTGVTPGQYRRNRAWESARQKGS